jgi:tetratricopeptide (TPR) repeat protein
MATGRIVRCLEGGHTAGINAVSFSPDGKLLATASRDRTVRLWDVASGRLLPTALTHPYRVNDVAFAPNGRYLVSAGGGGLVRIWDVETATVVATLPGHAGVLEQARFSPDGRWLATAGWDQTIRLWDMAAEPAAVLRHVFRGHADCVFGLSFSRDGRRLASVSRDHTLRIWDVASGNDALTLGGHTDYLTGVAFSPDDRLLVSAGSDVKIWQADDFSPEVQAERAKAAARLAVLWHEHAAQECLHDRPTQWFGVAFHVSRLLDARPTDPELYVRRGDAEVAQSLWQQAVDDYARSIELGTTSPWPWLQQGWLRCQLGDRIGYRRACAFLLQRFGRTDEAKLANEVAWVCALAPAAAADLDLPIRLAEKAVAAEPENAAYRRTLGILFYRVGRFSAARDCLLEAARLGRGQGTPEDWLILAMTHRALGHDAEARGWLDKATQSVEATRSEMLDRTDATVAGVARRAQLQLLRREAVARLGGKQRSVPASPSHGR